MGRRFKFENGYVFECTATEPITKAKPCKPDHLRYLIDENGETYRVDDVHEWAKKFANQHHVLRDWIKPGFLVSTVFLGVMPLKDHVGNVPFISGSYLFETIVFGVDGVAVDGAKYADLDGAKRGHEFILARWRKSLGVDPGRAD